MKEVRIGKLCLHEAQERWYVRIDGKQKYLAYKGASKEEAELELAKLRLQLHSPVDATKTPDDESVKLLFSTYLDRVQGESSAKNYGEKKRFIESFIAHYGDKPLKEIKAIHILDWLKSQNTRTTGGGKRQAYGHLSACFNWCFQYLDTTCLPNKRVTGPKRFIRSEEYVVSEGEYRDIIPLMKGTYRDAATVLWETGARPDEILGATIEEYEPENHQLDKGLNNKLGYKGKIRLIVLNDVAEQIIRQHIGERKSGLIFLTKGRPLSERWMNESFIAAARKVGRTKPTVLYGLRHSFATRMLKRLIPINLVADLLGHTVAICQRHYDKTLKEISTQRHLLN